MESKSNQGFLEEVSHLLEDHIDVKTEVIAGITTFMAMAYILTMNPNVLSAAGVDRDAVFTVAVLASLVVTLLIAAFASYPFVLASGMGLSAYSAYTVVFQMGYTWQMVLAAVFVEGLILTALSLIDVREIVLNVIPVSLKHAVSVGIGLFVAFIGLQNAKIMVGGVTLMSVFSFKGSLETGTFNSVGITVLLALVGVPITGIPVVKNIEGNILQGILITWILGIICGVIRLYQPNTESGMFSVLPNFPGGFGIRNMAPIFFKTDFSGILSLSFVTIMFAFLFVDMFDTPGTLIGVTSRADMLGKDGKLPKVRSVLLSDAIGISLGAVFDIPTTTIFVESTSSVAEGGRTGLTSAVAAIFFDLSLFLSPIFLATPSSATTPALIIVGFLVMSSVLKIDFNGFAEAIPSYIAIIAMPFMYSISEGITMGAISYVVINVATDYAKGEKIGLLMYVSAVLFVLRYVLI